MASENVCGICSKDFPSVQAHRKHNRLIHTKKSMKSVKTILRTSHHEKLIELPCNICSKIFCNKSTLTRHVNNVHKDERPHKCTECEKSFYSRSKIKRHMNTHTETKAKCSICEKILNKEYYVLHIRNVHQKSEPKFNCSVCEFRTRDKAYKTT